MGNQLIALYPGTGYGDFSLNYPVFQIEVDGVKSWYWYTGRRRDYFLDGSGDTVTPATLEAKTKELYWFPHPIQTDDNIRVFSLLPKLRETLEEVLEGEPVFRYIPADSVEQEYYRNEITIGMGTTTQIQDEIKRWYGALLIHAKQYLFRDIQEETRSDQTTRVIDPLVRLAFALGEEQVEEAYLHKLLSTPQETRYLNGIIDDLNAAYDGKLNSFKDRETTERALAALQNKIVTEH